MKQTAVEWLESELKNSNGLPYKHFEEIINQAKEMEKEQIENSFNYAQFDLGMEADDYIKETFKSK